METDAFFLKPFRDPVGAAAGGFLGRGGGEPDIAPGNVSFPDQFVRRLEHGPQAAFVIQRAAAPEPAFRDFTGKGAVSPLAAGLHHVMVVHEQVRLRGGIPSRPAENEPVREFRIFRALKQRREHFLQHFAEGMEFDIPGSIRPGDGLQADQPGQGFRIAGSLFIHHFTLLHNRLCRGACTHTVPPLLLFPAASAGICRNNYIIKNDSSGATGTF